VLVHENLRQSAPLSGQNAWGYSFRLSGTVLALWTSAALSISAASARGLPNYDIPAARAVGAQPPAYSDADYAAILHGYQAFLACDPPERRSWSHFLSCIKNVHPENSNEFIGFNFGNWVLDAQTAALAREKGRPKIADKIELTAVEYYKMMRALTWRLFHYRSATSATF